MYEEGRRKKWLLVTGQLLPEAMMAATRRCSDAEMDKIRSSNAIR